MMKRKRTSVKGKKHKPSSKSLWLAPALGAGFAAGATALGFGALAPAASMFGNYVGQSLKDITGYGAYTLNKNVLSGTVPSVGNTSRVEGGLTISHREYLGDIITSGVSGEFSIQGFTINPGNYRTWEWLTQIAMNYEQWIPEGILFMFKSTSADALNSINTALGTVTMATQYNPYDTPFDSKAQMESYEYSTSGRPTENIIHMIECDPMQGAISTYYVSNNGATNSGPDRRFSDLGIFYIATSGFQGARVNIGELWVTYQITLLKPKLYQSLGLGNEFISTFRDDTGSMSMTNGLIRLNMVNSASNTLEYYNPEVPGVWNPEQLGLRQGDRSTEMYWPQYSFGTAYKISIEWSLAASTTISSFTLTDAANDAASSRYAPKALGLLDQPGSGASTSQLHVSFYVNVPGGALVASPMEPPSTTLTYIGTAITNIDQLRWDIIQVPYPVKLPTGY